MTRILITSGPTRQYLDPVRYLTNASSGRMGAALAAAALDREFEVEVVSGPVEIAYPHGARVTRVVSTDEMLEACQNLFPSCGGMIGAAAPCDYRPHVVAQQKIAKTGGGLTLELIETDDIVASLAAGKGTRWVVGFALETNDHRLRALAKLQRKHCDLMVSNSAEAINAVNNRVEILAPDGAVLRTAAGSKDHVAREIIAVIEQRLVLPRQSGSELVR